MVCMFERLGYRAVRALPSRRALALAIACVLALGGCVRSNLRHVDDGDDALRRGKLADAERAYERALAGDPDLDEPERDAWVLAKVEQGRARIELARIKQQRPWRDLRGTPAAILTELHALGERVRSLGGDAESEAAIVEAMNGMAGTALAALPTSGLSAWGQLREARSLVPFPELTAETLAPLAILQAAARAVHAAEAATAPGPLARRVHTALGAWIDETELAAARDLAAPYARGIAVTLRGPAAGGCAALAPIANLPVPGTQRTLEVTVDVARCSADVRVETGQQMATWSERVLERVETTPIYETRCQNTYTEVRQCFGNPLTCYAGTLVPTSTACFPAQIGVAEKPIYRTEQRSGTRPVETQTGEYVVELTWTARMGDRTWSGEVRKRTPAAGTRGPAYAVLGPFSEGWTSPDVTFDAAGAELDRALRSLFDQQTADERAAARARAESLASDPLAADEAWVAVALLGGDVDGRWRTWGLDAASIRTAFDAHRGGASARLAIGTAKSIYIPERPRISEAQRKALESRLVPTLGATLWIDLHGGVATTPEVAAPMGTDQLAGTSAAIVGMRVGYRGLSSMRRHTDGFGFVDDLAGEMHAGIVFDQPETAIGTSQLGFAATYTAAVGFRRIGALGLFAGVRGAASWIKFGTSSGTHAAVTPMARLELWLGRSTIVIDAMSRTLAGGRHEALTINLGRIKQDGPGAKLTSFLTLRAERRVLDATVQLPYEVDGDISPDYDVGDLEATIITAAYGFGF